MSTGGPRLTEVELKFPFAPSSRNFFESIPIEDSLASREVVDQASARLMSALGRGTYRPHMSELIEFSSFFASVLVASQDGFLGTKFARKESERAKEYFIHERPAEKVSTMRDCFGAELLLGGDEERADYTTSFEAYLALVTKYELTKSPTWKLSRQALRGGTILLSDNMLNDLFGECAFGAISEGVRRLKGSPFPRQLEDLKAKVMDYVPVQRPRTGKGYDYVDELLKHPVTDGRHRLTWLVLAPFLVNVKKLENEEAVARIRAFVAFGGETSAMRRFIEYNVKRAKRNGLLPPTLSTLKREHPDLYALMPKDALASDQNAKKRASGDN